MCKSLLLLSCPLPWVHEVFFLVSKRIVRRSNRPFPSSPGPLYQNEVRCSTFDMEMTFHSHANKTHFHKKSWAPNLVLIQRPGETRKWPIQHFALYALSPLVSEKTSGIQGRCAFTGTRIFTLIPSYSRKHLRYLFLAYLLSTYRIQTGCSFVGEIYCFVSSHRELSWILVRAVPDSNFTAGYPSEWYVIKCVRFRMNFFMNTQDVSL